MHTCTGLYHLTVTDLTGLTVLSTHSCRAPAVSPEGMQFFQFLTSAQGDTCAAQALKSDAFSAWRTAVAGGQQGGAL